jgi:hypothetical protein
LEQLPASVLLQLEAVVLLQLEQSPLVVTQLTLNKLTLMAARVMTSFFIGIGCF